LRQPVEGGARARGLAGMGYNIGRQVVVPALTGTLGELLGAAGCLPRESGAKFRLEP